MSDGPKQALTADQVRLVLRRAAELERKPEPHDAAVGEHDVAEIAAEVGIAPDAVRQALSEVRAGLVTTDQPQPTFLDRLVGAAETTFSRRVPGPLPEVRGAVERFLRGQLLQLKRNLGERGQLWEPAPDLWSRVRRAFDVGQRVAFERGSELHVQLVPGGRSAAEPSETEDVLVRMTLRLREPRRRRALSVGVGAAGGLAIAVAGLAAFHGLPLDLVAIAAGSATAGGTLASNRRHHRRDVEQVEGAVLRFFDSLEYDRQGPARG